MADPVKHPEFHNIDLNPPDPSDPYVSVLPAFRDGDIVYSWWKLTLIERLRVLVRGRVRLAVMGHYHPPVSVDVER